MLRPVCAGCEEGPGVCAMALTVFSLVLIIFTLPLSLVFVVKVVQVRSTSLIRFHFPESHSMINYTTQQAISDGNLLRRTV